MNVSELLLPELDEEIKMTRSTLERVPVGEPDFAPHAKSMPMGRLAFLVAQLGAFGLSVLTTPEFDLSKGNFKPAPLESAAQLVKMFDEGTTKVRSALAGIPDEKWKDNWKLVMKDKKLFEGSRFLAYRQMFLNHLVHHRAQLGVYLRMNNLSVPAIYGPSADEKLGF
jgi:hypothetical protein